MDCFLKKIFEGQEADELVHLQFEKFSKGEFKDKASVIARKTKDAFNITTTPEYSNEFVRMLAEKLGDRSTDVKGVIVSTRDLDNELEFQNKKQFMGIKQYVIEREMLGREIIELLNKFPRAFFGLSFNVDKNELKVKPKAPKSAKPSTKGEGKPKVNFCKLKTGNTEIAKNILFDLDLGSLKKVEIYHDFVIEDIIVSEGEEDFAKMRELAKRKGKVVRKIIIDEKETQKEIEFCA